MGLAEEIDVVIVGGGVCGLATALALHRKGIKSTVVEKSKTLPTTGAAFGIPANGWRALHHLGLASLQSKAMPVQRAMDLCLDNGLTRETCMRESGDRCITRNNLVQALANELPSGTICFGCQVMSIDVEKSSSNPIIQLHNGSLIKAKVLIGCDGANSTVAKFIGLKPTQPFSKFSVRALTIYPSGHGFAPELLRISKGGQYIGRMPVDENTVYWFVIMHGDKQDYEMISKDPASIKQLTINSFAGFPNDIVEMIEKSELTSLSLTRLRFRAPWNLFLGNFRKESVIVAGDAWHVMGPFLGQGVSSALEDAILLARCLSNKLCYNDSNTSNQICISKQNTRDALDEFLKERRLRVLKLSTQTYVTGLLAKGDTSYLVRLICMVVIVVLFRDPFIHTKYDCGEL